MPMDQAPEKAKVYYTPGVYRRVRPVETKDIRLVRTDIAGFVGFTERGPLPPSETTDEIEPTKFAKRLTGWNEFVATFGWFIPYGYLAYAVRAFFENGGTTCYVARVAATKYSEPSKRPKKARVSLPSGMITGGMVLKAEAGKGQDNLTVDAADSFQPGDLVKISGNGITEFAIIEEVADATTLKLSRKLRSLFSRGTIITKYEPALQIVATNEGNWGNRIRLSVTPLITEDSDKEFAMRVTVEQGYDRSRPAEEEFYKRLSLSVQSPFYAPNIINEVSKLITVEARASILLFSDEHLRLDAVYLEGGQDGLSEVQTRDFTGGTADLRGIRLLEEIDEVAILCVPDAVFETPPALSQPPPVVDLCAKPLKPAEADAITDDLTAIPPALDTYSIYQSTISQCERLRDRVAILDSQDRLSTKQVVKWRDNFHTRFGALYYPWLKVPDVLNIEGLPRRIPSCGHVAGVYAQIDNQFGVQRPPANTVLEFVTDVGEEITALQQEDLNPYAVNAIRTFPGRGIRVWGARSLAQEPEWQFIHVRRLMSMIEESVEYSTQWTVFESNNEALRRTLVHSLSVFLETIWRKGGLKGNQPAQGFYVKCDDTNNPQSVVDVGQLICEIGVAVVVPMEFLVFELRQSPSGAATIEL